MSKMNLLTMQAFASVLIFLLSACAEDPLDGKEQTGKGHTVTLRLSASVPIRKDSTDINFTTKTLATRAPSVLKNVYALLFTGDGAFNGCASIGTFTVGTPQDGG